MKTNNKSHRTRAAAAAALQQGFTLIELLVGIALGLFVLLGLVSASTALMRGDVIAAARMGNELRSAAYVFERDVRRAGYTAGAVAEAKKGAATYNNTFALLDVSTPGCVRYSYDLNGNGTQDTAVGSDERFAVVLSGGQLFMRRSGGGYDCDVTQGVWEPLVDSSVVTVSEFTATVDQRFEDLGSGRKLYVRTLNYTLSTKLNKAPAKTMTHTNSVVLPNDIVS